MSFMSFIGCSMDRHEPVRREVKWSGKGYVGHCKHCHEPIERLAHREWKKRPEQA